MTLHSCSCPFAPGRPSEGTSSEKNTEFACASHDAAFLLLPVCTGTPIRRHD